jgi:hypothetical protein
MRHGSRQAGVRGRKKIQPALRRQTRMQAFGGHWPLTRSFFLKKVPVPLPKKLAMPLRKNEG